MWPRRNPAKLAVAEVSGSELGPLRDRIEKLELKLEIDRLAILNTIEKVTRQLQGRITKREARSVAPEKKPRPWELQQRAGFVAHVRSEEIPDVEEG